MTKDEIFQKYLEDKCPVCGMEVDGNHYHTETITNGKIMAKYFSCPHCFSEYTIGYQRRSNPIESEITFNAVAK
jgi:C4-type Zn-finger protein